MDIALSNDANITLNSIRKAAEGIDAALMNEASAFSGILSISKDAGVPINANQTILEASIKTINELVSARRDKLRSISAMKKLLNLNETDSLLKGCPEGLHGLGIILFSPEKS